MPLNDGGAVATYNGLKHLHAAGHRVTVLALNPLKHHQPPASMQDVCTTIHSVRIDTDVKASRALLHLFDAVPYKYRRFYSPAFEALLVQILQNESFDIVQIEHSPMVVYTDTIRQHSDCPIVLRNHNVEYILVERMAANAGSLPARWYFQHLARGAKGFEERYYQKLDGIFAMTEIDCERIRGLGFRGPLEAIPLGVNLEMFVEREDITSQSDTLFYFGAFDWRPNCEAIHWFMKEVFNKLKRRHPELKLHIGGKKPSPAILAYDKLDGVVVHPDVPSAPAFMQSYDILIVPLLTGGGMRVKIVEAMAMAKPIISTRVGAEGIQAKNGVNIMFAETAEEFIGAISRLLGDRGLKDNLAANARTTARSTYNWQSITSATINFYERIREKHRTAVGS